MKKIIDKIDGFMNEMEDKFAAKKSREFSKGSEDSMATSGRSSDVVVKQLNKIPEYVNLPVEKQSQILGIMGI